MVPEFPPESWLRRGENTLVVFDENGNRPDGVALTVKTVASRTVTQITAPAKTAAK